MTTHFQVDLRGIVDLLAQNLYSSPRVYVRELLQNAVDAITERRRVDGSCPDEVTITVRDGTLTITDTGIGLLPDEVERFLATVGRSSKRDDLFGARQEMLGQFGIGLLSAFMVADEIRVVTRSARRDDAPTVEWLASSDGSYTTTVLKTERPEPGTTVELTAADDRADWLEASRVTELAAHFGAMLPVTVTVNDAPVTTVPPWRSGTRSSLPRRAALAAFCQDTLGFAPLDVIELDELGTEGALFVLPNPAPPTHRATHRVWLKGMLLGERVDGLVPDWAFFVRGAVDTSVLRPTASREALYEDDALLAIREAIGNRIRGWLTDLVAHDPARAADFLRVHHLGVKALAVHDPTMLDLVVDMLPYETTAGSVTLREFHQQYPTMHVTESVEDFRRIAAVAAAQGLGVVNAGYVYDADLLRALGRRDGWNVLPMDGDVVGAHLDPLPAESVARWQPVLAALSAALDPHGVDVEVRTYEPVSVPVLYLDDRAVRHEQARREAEAVADPLWASVLSGFATEQPRPRVVFNERNPLVRRLPTLADAELLRLAAESLYIQSLLLAHRPLRAAESAVLNRSLATLLDRATGERDGR